MTQFAFAIDQRACIGCHACTVACKVEHGVELGVFRTWVKYVEHGDFPESSRSFSVLRCNHCSDAPCVEICPVTALYKREDGIVDFDPERCIGCKACLNACPYDALYIDPGSHTAAKCNFCAHRVDGGLKPACEVVCPTGAIVSGDVDDPRSPVARLLEQHPATTRSPEQGTGPNVFYIGVDEVAIDPLAVASAGAYLHTEMSSEQQRKLEPLAAEARAVATGDVDHPAAWGWRVSSYFLTKGTAAGAMMLAPFVGGALPGVIALGGIALTGALLISDLKRPERFHRLFTRPQWRSWLAIGAQCINLAAVVALAYTAAALAGWSSFSDALAWAMLPAGALLAAYTAFLFGQCEGRDLWQGRLLLPQTLVNALLAGAAALLVADAADLARPTLVASALVGLGLALLDALGPHGSGQARRAARNLWRDRYAAGFWAGLALIGAAAALAAPLPVAAGAAALAGLWLYEDAWVRAGQSVPLS